MATALGGGAENPQLRGGAATLLVAAVTLLCGVRVAWSQDVPTREPRVIPVYLIPKDLSFDLRRLRLNVQALEDVRQWYSAALAGPTFESDPFIVHHSRHTFEEFAAHDFQDWWPLLQDEFRDRDLAWNDSADFKLLFLAQGAGGWAGADSENGGIDSVADAAKLPKGEYGGLVVIGDSSVSGILAGVCPMDGVESGTIWWCNWNTYRGTIAHELGHTWGIPHPDAFKPPGPDGRPARWDCAIDGNTVMQCHRNFPYDSLLTYEAAHFRSLRFFQGTADRQYHLLSDMLPSAIEGEVRLHRLSAATDHSGGVVWVDDPGQGSATGFSWAVVVTAGGRVEWRLPEGCATVVADVGRERGAEGDGAVEVVAGGSPLAVMPVATGWPRELVVRYCGAKTLELRSTGESTFRAVFGNARLYRTRGREPEIR